MDAMKKAEGKGTTQASSPQKPKFVPAPWADGKPLATAFPPRKPPLPYVKGVKSKDFPGSSGLWPDTLASSVGVGFIGGAHVDDGICHLLKYLIR